MGLLGRIAEEQGAKQGEQMEADTDAAVEQSRPDATKTADESRNAYSQATAEGQDVDMQDEQPEAGEQEMFTAAEKFMAEKIYSNESAASIVEAIQTGGDPVQAIGELSSAMVMTVTNEFPDMSEDVIFAIGESAVEQMVDLAESADDSINLNDDQVAEAFSIGIGHWMEENPDAMEGDMQDYNSAEAPLQLQQGGAPNQQVTNQNQGAEPTPEEAEAAAGAQAQNSGSPIERV